MKHPKKFCNFEMLHYLSIHTFGILYTTFEKEIQSPSGITRPTSSNEQGQRASGTMLVGNQPLLSTATGNIILRQFPVTGKSLKGTSTINQ